MKITQVRNIIYKVATFSLAALAPTLSGLCEEAHFVETNVFVSGQGGYHTYRIPALVKTNNDTLLAFCEGRKKSRSDAGDIDLLVKRSTDGGDTWSDQVIIWDDAENTCGNPCPVVDRQTGTIWLPVTWNSGTIHEGGIKTGWNKNSRRVFVLSSTDDGETWTPPIEITRDVKPYDWSWYATGPGAGIQLERGAHAGRLIIPCDHNLVSEEGSQRFSHVIYSDDHGQSWHLGGRSPEDQTNECEVVELADNRLLLNMRNYDRSTPARQICFSHDGGTSWENQHHDATLIEPVCQASIRRYRWPTEEKPGVVLFSNPATKNKRRLLTVRVSYDDCQTWPVKRVIQRGVSAYSCLCVLPKATIGCFYEKDDYRTLTLARFNLAWLEE